MHMTPRFSSFLAAAFLAISTQAMAAEPRVLASVIQPPGGLDCDRAADQASVVFDFQQPRADIKQVSVFVNGKGVKEDAVSQDWPRLTLKRGLHVGRNTVEAVATGADDKSVSHKLTVLVGEAPRKGEKGSAIVDCGAGSDVARANDDDESWGEEIDDEAVEDIDDEVEYVEDDVEYVYDAPRYIYRPYPVFSFVVYQPAYYYPYPYYSYYYQRPYRHDPYYRGGGYSRGYGWPRGHRSGSYHGGDHHQGGGYHSDAGRPSYRPSRPATHESSRGGSGQQLSPPRAERSPPPARSESQRTERGRGWR